MLPNIDNLSSVKRRFEQNQQDCNFTVLSLIPSLGENLFGLLNVEALTVQLQQLAAAATKSAQTAPVTQRGGQGGGNASSDSTVTSKPTTISKVELWQRIKHMGKKSTLTLNCDLMLEFEKSSLAS